MLPIGMMHINRPCAPPAVGADDPATGCCMGEAAYDPTRCTCWEPIFDVEQAEPQTDTEPTTRAKCCHDCAYRQGSPEREGGMGDDLDGLAEGRGSGVFWCHAGLRRAVSYRHPDGRVLPAGDGDYRPPILAGVPYKADGTAGERCGGWNAKCSAAT